MNTRVKFRSAQPSKGGQFSVGGNTRCELPSAARVAAVVVVALGVVHLLMGRDGDAAAAAGGFIGFGRDAMPVGLTAMRCLNARFGDAPRARPTSTLASMALFAWIGT